MVVHNVANGNNDSNGLHNSIGSKQRDNEEKNTHHITKLTNNEVRRKIRNSQEVMKGRENLGFDGKGDAINDVTDMCTNGQDDAGHIEIDVDLDHQKKKHVVGNQPSVCQWIVLIAGCYNAFVVLGFPFSLGVLYVELISYYNASRTQVSLVQAICVGLLYGGGILVGFISKAIGVRGTLFFGSLLASLGLFASWFATGPYYVIISIGVVTGFGSCMGFVPLLAAVASNFHSRSSLAITTLMTFGGVGSLVLPKLFAHLVEIFSWKGAMLILCCLYLNVLVGSLLVTSPVISSAHKSGKKENAVKQKKSSWRMLLKPLYCTYILASMIAFGSLNGVTFTLVDFGEGKGLSLGNGINLLLALNASNTSTRFLTGFIKMIPRLHTVHLFSIAVIFGSTSVFTLVYISGFSLMLVFCVTFGLGLGILISIFPVGVYELSGEKMYPFALGIGTSANGIANTMAGITVGVLYDLTGSYLFPYQIFCGTALSGVCLLLLVFFVESRRGTQKFHLPQLNQGEDDSQIDWQKFMYL